MPQEKYNLSSILNLKDIIIRDENFKFNLIDSISAKSLLAANINFLLNKKILLITDTSKNAEKYFNDISVFSKRNVLYFDGSKFHYSILPSEQLPDIIITPFKNITLPLPNKFILQKNILNIYTEQEIDREMIIDYCKAHNYNFTFKVENIGDTAIRGEIVDIFSPNYEMPVRIEFEYNKISSIRFFNILNQRTESYLEKIVIYPFSLDYKDNSATLIDILSEYIVIVDNEIKFQKEDNSLQTTKEKILKKFKVIEFNSLTDEQSININFKNIDSFYRKLNLFSEKIKFWQNNKYKIFIFTYSADRIYDILQDDEISVIYHSFLYQEQFNYDKYPVILFKDKLSSGFEYPDEKIIIISDGEIFSSHFIPQKRKIKIQKKSIGDILELEPNDYVIHINYGIGKYIGIKNIKLEDKYQDFIEIKYAKEEKLFIPLDSINFLRRYENISGAVPKLNSLSGNTWSATKKRVKKKVKEVANELKKLYQTRKNQKGFAFSEDTVWQKELEDSFPYSETEGQAQAIADVKRDMEKDIVMDRLICGDVGFGKTEIALRAAFKAVQDNKQAAILVPTTLLAHQHYLNFIERLSIFPVNIEVLSRFIDKEKQKKIINDIKTGVVDIIVGTHRLLQKDISFKDLGLLVIDEEHRFGVLQKEKLKYLKSNVDSLVLTATPIPRTLHIALTGIRDISIIDTSPEDRLSIKTYLFEFNENILKEAISKEIDRGGQVYYVYNKVKTIERQKNFLQEMFPFAKICIAHGQMDEFELQKKFLNFIEGKYDILLCSTIIESGIDIPNVNTIIISDAENFGLAQLYQLRGRVGRSNKQAYCYLLYNKYAISKGKVWDRLQALKEFTELGSSFQLAKRDLEIRGAGNILGVEQSGFIDQVGVDLYCEFLEEEIKGDDFVREKERNVVIDIPVNAYIPDEYISNWKEKIILYRRMANINTFEEALDLKEETIDRFGKMTKEVENLFDLVNIKLLAKSQGIMLIEYKNKILKIKFFENSHLEKKVSQIKDKYIFRKIYNEIYFEIIDKKNILNYIEQILKSY